MGLDLSVCLGHSTTVETGSTVNRGMIKIYYFARCRILAGCHEEKLELQLPCSLEDVRQHILDRHPALAEMMQTTRLALNCEFAIGTEEVEAGDEVALIPPVSGGAPSPMFIVSEAPIAADAAVQAMQPIPPTDGGLGTFTGIVRKNSLGKEVEFLVYEAYSEMAIRKMKEITSEARAKWDITKAAIVHRTGRLEIGEVAVSIAVSAPHRAPALEACRYIIERLKEDVPIWKMEQGVDPSSSWGKGP